MSKFTADVRINDYPNHDPKKDIYVESFDEESTINDLTEYLVIGTLTPPKGRGKHNEGYFYCSDKNHMYEYIDSAKHLGLCHKKEEFIKNWDPKIKQEIIDILIDNNIAFLDVVDEAYAVRGSSKDDDIVCYTLATKYFKKVNFSNPKLKIVANSLNAYDVIMKIFKELDVKHDVEIIPQQLRGYTKENRSGKTYKDKTELLNNWIAFFE